jgi:Holliday junction resolvase
MSGRRSRNKGARIEREIVRALHGKGFAAARIPLSGAVGRSVLRGCPCFRLWGATCASR